jgi:hypothetical protein
MCNKKNKPILSNRIRIFLGIISFCFLMYLQPAADAYSTSFDFGPVAVGATSTTTVTVYNEEAEAVEVTGIAFAPEGCSYFSVVLRNDSMLIPGGGTLGIDVNFSPNEVGECSNLLRIWAGSPIPHTVAFSGTGVVNRTLLEDKIQEILKYLDTHMKGKGPGNSAENRLNALRNMIEASAVLIKNGQNEAAWHKLSEIYQQADDFSDSMDFIDEGSTERIYSENTLAGLIKDLMTLLESDLIKTKKLARSKATF